MGRRGILCGYVYLHCGNCLGWKFRIDICFTNGKWCSFEEGGKEEGSSYSIFIHLGRDGGFRQKNYIYPAQRIFPDLKYFPFCIPCFTCIFSARYPTGRVPLTISTWSILCITLLQPLQTLSSTSTTWIIWYIVIPVSPPPPLELPNCADRPSILAGMVSWGGYGTC